MAARMTLLVALAGALVAQGAPVVVREGFGAGAYQPGNGVITPTLLVQKAPQYTQEGLRAKIEGSVEIEIVVNADGSVGDAHVTKSLDSVFGLDAKALDAVRQWRYLPALLNGKSVPCLVSVTVPFKLTTPTSTVKGDPPSQETAEEFRKGAYLEDTPDLVKPTLITQATSEYTNEARQRKISGDVELEAIVMPDGSIGKVRITKSLDRTYGLDQQAVNSVRKWKFRPGLLNGLPVPVVVAVTIAFRLH
jgi:TonB family protein